MFAGAILLTDAQSNQIDEAGKARFGSGSRFIGHAGKIHRSSRQEARVTQVRYEDTHVN